MKRIIAPISVLLFVMLLISCSNNTADQVSTNSVETIAAIVNATLSAIPTITTALPTTTPTVELTPATEVIEETSSASIFTDTPIPSLVPLYWELTWENLGRSEQEVLVNPQTNERTTLSGYLYQAPLPSEKNDLTNNVNSYYSERNMANMDWLFVSGAGGVGSLLAEFYNESGYFLTVTTQYGASSLITVWISDQTVIVPVIPPTPSQ